MFAGARAIAIAAFAVSTVALAARASVIASAASVVAVSASCLAFCSSIVVLYISGAALRAALAVAAAWIPKRVERHLRDGKEVEKLKFLS